MMRRCSVYLFLGACLFGLLPDVTGHLECSPTTETKILSPHIEDEDKPTCPTLIGMPVDPSRFDFREECQRWLGTPTLPDHVNNYYINYCQESSSYTKYRAEICCDGVTTERRCFQCTNYTSDDTCAYTGQVVTCSSTEVCQTTSDFYDEYPYTFEMKTAGCDDATVCDDRYENNDQTCKDYIPKPQCTQCCDEVYCSYDTIDYHNYVAYDPCVSNPCYSIAINCTSNITDWSYKCLCPPGYSGNRCQYGPCESYNYPCENGGSCKDTGDDYTCLCKQGWGGKNCTTAYGPCPSGTEFCINGGNCTDHGSYGYRCNCPDGFVGSICEFKTLKCAYAPGLYQSTSSYMSSSSQNCTYRVQSERENGVNNQNYLDDYCPNHMHQDGSGNPYFKDDVHGDVDRLESSSLWYCEKGEVDTWYSREFCCPTCYSMPCQNGAWCMQDVNDYGTYICKCRAGWTGRQCQNRRHLCIVTGDPHYTTFDQELLHYQGESIYQLSGSDGSVPSFESFLVKGDNMKGGCDGQGGGSPNVTYLEFVETEVLGHVVKFGKSGDVLKVWLDGQTFDPTHDGTGISGLKIIFAGANVIMEATLSNATPPAVLSVEFNTYCTAYIDLPPEYTNRVEGICGDADGNPDNDLTTKEGVDVRHEPNKYTLVGDSWELTSTNKTESGEDIEMECPPEFEDEVSSHLYCGLINDTNNVFGPCIKDPDIHQELDYQNCRYDVCAFINGTEEERKYMACRSVEAFAIKCESKGHMIDWRDVAECPFGCRNSTEYSFSAPACHATCAWPDAPEQCHLPDREGCYCPSDMVMGENGICEDARKCGCVDENGKRWQIGDSWLSEDCTTNNTCVVCTECPRPVGKIVPQPYSCSGDDVCVPLGDGDHQCQHTNCPGCTCTDGNGQVWQIGENGLSTDCDWNMTCVVCEECIPIVGNFWKEEHSCDPTETCIVDAGKGQCQAALHSSTTRWSKWSRWSICLKHGTNNWIRYRTRRCLYPDMTSADVTCHGNYIEQKACVKPRTGRTKSKKHNEV